MNSARQILWGALLLMLALPAHAAEGQGAEKRSDLWLKARLVTAYTLNEHLNPFKLDVEVKEGVAHLGGTVDSDIERDLAVEIARGIEGIHGVEERIRIEPGAGAGERREPDFFRTVEDATITARVKSKLLWNRNTSGLEIDVDTDAGVVTLAGEVVSGAHRDLAVQLAKNTTGVRQVRDELRVVSAPENAREQGPLETVEAKVSDAWVTAKVKSMLLISKGTEGADLQVSTEEGIVTLKGSVVSEEQKERVEMLAGDTVGVRGIRSRLEVRED